MVRSFTKGSPVLLILSFSIPLFLGNFFQQFYSLADTFIVGRMLGKFALAAVGSTNSLNLFFFWFIYGFSFGASLMVSRRMGASDMDGVRRSFAINIVICTVMALTLMTVGVLSVRGLLKFLNTPPEIIDDAYSYIVIIFWGIPLLLLFNMLSNVIRAVGDSRTPLYFLIISCVLNIILDVVFITFFHSGLRGVAFATLISQSVSSLLCVVFIVKKLPVLKLTAKDWRFTGKEIVEHIKTALPVGFQGSIIAIGFMSVSFFLNRLGVPAVAAFTAGSRIDATVTVIIHSLGTAMATFTAQNYGANKPERIRKGIFQISIITYIYCIVTAILFIFFGHHFAGLFLMGASPGTIDMSHTYLIINSSFYILLATLAIFRGALQGMGNNLAPTLAGIMELIMRVFASIVFSRLAGFTGLCFACPLAWFGSLLPLTIALVNGVYKHDKLLPPYISNLSFF